MSTATERKRRRVRRGSEEEVFRYGWHYVKKRGSNGKEEFERVPLTLEEMLHPPYEEDFRVVSEEHVKDCRYLQDVLTTGFPKLAVLSDHRIAWDDEEKLTHGPDCIVIEGPRKRLRPGATYYVSAEKAKALLIIEIVSPDYAHLDTDKKVKEYHQVGVPIYIIADTKYRDGKRVWCKLIAYQWTPSEYVRMPDSQGRYWIDSLRLYVGLEGVQVALYDKDGKKFPGYSELAEGKRSAETKARAAETKARAAETKATAEAKARQQLEAKMRAMEEELQRLRERK
jgi:Uma2 family endonuclease